MKKTLALFAVATVLLLGSCSKKENMKPQNKIAATVVGSWKGSVNNTVEGTSYYINVTLKQSADSISGVFLTYAVNGNVKGSISADSVFLTLIPAASSGYDEVDTFKGILNTASDQISGTFKSTVPGISGTFNFKKE